MRKKSLITMLVTICLIGVVGVGATLAYLSDAEAVTNTFSFGNTDIELDEPNFDGGDKNEVTDIVPGQPIPKDPTVSVAAGSVNSYVYMSVKGIDGSNFSIDGINAAWKKVDASTGDIAAVQPSTSGFDGIYVYVGTVAEGETAVPAVVAKSTSKTNLPALFTSVTYSADVTESATVSHQILIKAAAVQADNFAENDSPFAVVKDSLAFAE